mmetsp:Transcript_112932/g.360735  ORF Transcript_112932/g.360735 Transcript_112932/m.360735 type:complete len:274 (+) Transcript_112932:51-872(+)
MRPWARAGRLTSGRFLWPCCSRWSGSTSSQMQSVLTLQFWLVPCQRSGGAGWSCRTQCWLRASGWTRRPTACCSWRASSWAWWTASRCCSRVSAALTLADAAVRGAWAQLRQWQVPTVISHSDAAWTGCGRFSARQPGTAVAVPPCASCGSAPEAMRGSQIGGSRSPCSNCQVRVDLEGASHGANTRRSSGSCRGSWMSLAQASQNRYGEQLRILTAARDGLNLPARRRWASFVTRHAALRAAAACWRLGLTVDTPPSARRSRCQGCASCPWK